MTNYYVNRRVVREAIKIVELLQRKAEGAPWMAFPLDPDQLPGLGRRESTTIWKPIWSSCGVASGCRLLGRRRVFDHFQRIVTVGDVYDGPVNFNEGTVDY